MMTPDSQMTNKSSSENLVPVGALFFPVAESKPEKRFSFLLLPNFTLLAFSSALEPLRIANQLSQKPLYKWDIISEDGQSVRSSSGVDIAVRGSIDDLSQDSHLLVCSGNLGTAGASDKTLARLRRHQRFGGGLGGICTGAVTLAQAGLLGRRRFTLHWENQPGFAETFHDLSPSSRRFETDGDLLTCGGGAAAVEMMLWVIERDYGKEFAIMVSEMCLRAGGGEPPDEQRSSFAMAISSRNPRVINVVREMHKSIEEPRTLEQLADDVGYSRRQIERQFRLIFNESPMQVYRNIRLDRARQLFSNSDLSVTEVATACGFQPGTHFSKTYSRRFGISPSAYRFHLNKDRA